MARRRALVPLSAGHVPMEVFQTPASMRAWSDGKRLAGSRIAFVPTMGALHAGHLALVDEARRRGDLVVVSIFVNPLQFDVRADFDRYPRPIDGDLAACREVGVDAVYAPTAGEMYPPGFQTHVTPGHLADRLEGAHRPGHFLGVTTVVAKLLGAVRPHVAVFGRKDAQQLAVVERMVADLDMGIEIVGMPTVREADGLALSSRNTRLSPADRADAACISAGLAAAVAAYEAGERSAHALTALATAPVLATPSARLEYLEVVDPRTFDPLERIAAEALVVTATWFGDVRLIDNVALGHG